jgi:hypothetical protein
MVDKGKGGFNFVLKNLVLWARSEILGFAGKDSELCTPNP